MQFTNPYKISTWPIFDQFLNKFGATLDSYYGSVFANLTIVVTDMNNLDFIIKDCGSLINEDFFKNSPYTSNSILKFIVDNSNVVTLSDDEKIALLAHECGHLYTDLSKTKVKDRQDDEEKADDFAIKLVLKTDLKSALTKSLTIPNINVASLQTRINRL